MSSCRPTDDLRRVLISGVGLVTPIGHSSWATTRALLDGRTTADRLADLPEDTEPVSMIRATAGVSIAASAPIDPAIDLAERAAREAMDQAGIDPGGDVAKTTDLVLASSKGAILSVLAPRQKQHRAQALLASPHGFLASSVRQRLGLGDATAPVAACATSLTALDRAAKRIALGEIDRAIVVAVEAALHPVFIHSYKRLGALAPVSPIHSHRALPLDRNRSGFTLCECAAAVVLEREERVTATKPWGRLIRTTTASEPFDLVRAADRFRALQRAVASVAQDVADFALVQPHATGTPDNDERELAALAEALGPRAQGTPVYASKGAIGHGLGAAGLINVVLGCLFARARRTPPTPWLSDPIESPFRTEQTGADMAPSAHLCVAAGFGGHVAACAFEPA